MPIRERAEWLLANEHQAQWVEPHKWPEVVWLADAFSKALDWCHPRLQSSSKTTIGLVRLLAEFEDAELSRAIVAAPDDDWLTAGRKGLGSLSVEVVSRLLNPKRTPQSQTRHRGPNAPVQPNHSEPDEFLEEMGVQQNAF